MLVTFQSLEAAKAEGKLHRFLNDTIKTFKASSTFTTMLEDEAYYNGENPFFESAISQLKKVMLDTGKVLDLTPLVGIYSNFAFRIVDQLVNRLWYFPVQVGNKERLGANFDDMAVDIANQAAIHGACYAFWNVDHIEAFKATEFIPLVDERTADNMAGIRFWQIDEKSPMYVQLYEVVALPNGCGMPTPKSLSLCRKSKRTKSKCLLPAPGRW